MNLIWNSLSKARQLLSFLFPFLTLWIVAIGMSRTVYADDFEATFNQGIAEFRSGKVDEAINKFNEAIRLQPDNPAAHANLALAYFKKENFGMATAYYRKAQSLDPGNKEIQFGLQKSVEKLGPRTLPHEIEFIESLHNWIFSSTRPWIYYFLVGTSFVAAGWIWLNYAGAKRRTVDAAPPRIPILGLLTGIIFVFSSILLGLKLWDLRTPRGTIIESQVSVLASPGNDQVELFTLNAGHEVLLRRVQNDWYQVQVSGGPSGWVKSSSLLVTTLSQLPNDQ